MPKPKTQNLPTTSYPLPTSEGAALVISVLLAGVLLSIVLTLSLIFIPKIRASSEIGKSPAALYAAESAIEWCLYANRRGSASMPAMSNGASFINGITNLPFDPADCSTSPIKAIGTYQGISRSFEISF